MAFSIEDFNPNVHLLKYDPGSNNVHIYDQSRKQLAKTTLKKASDHIKFCIICDLFENDVAISESCEDPNFFDERQFETMQDEHPELKVYYNRSFSRRYARLKRLQMTALKRAIDNKDKDGRESAIAVQKALEFMEREIEKDQKHTKMEVVVRFEKRVKDTFRDIAKKQTEKQGSLDEEGMIS